MSRRRGLAAALAVIVVAAGIAVAITTGGGDEVEPSPQAEAPATQAGSGEPEGRAEERTAQVDADAYAEALDLADEVERIDPPPPLEDGGDDSIETFGQEANERVAGALVASLAGFLNTRAERDWEGTCALLAGQIDELLSQLAAQARSGDAPVDCAAFMELSAGNLPRDQLRRLAQVRVGSVRVADDRGFVIYKNFENRWTAISMAREGGRWKVALLDGVPLR